MPGLSNAYEQLIYNYVARPGVAVTRHTALYLRFYTAITDAEAVTGTEVSSSGTGYAPIDVTSAFGAPDSTSGQGANSVEIVSGVPTANWGTITHFAIHTAASGGTPVSSAIPMSPTKTVNAGDPAVRFAPGELVWQVS